MTNRITQALSSRRALVGYLTAGDPNPELTPDIMHALVEGGCNLIELGMPFSDPMADGADIQAASERALAAGTTLDTVFEILACFRQKDPTTPVVLMGYLNPIHRMGYEMFAARAVAAGADGVLVVDHPNCCETELTQVLRMHGLDRISLIAPTTPPARLAQIAREAGGFVYYVSLKGVTGTALNDTESARAAVAEIRRHTDLPVGVGFGIRDAAAARAVAEFADAVIIGSSIVRAIADNPNNEATAVRELARSFKDAVSAA